MFGSTFGKIFMSQVSVINQYAMQAARTAAAARRRARAIHACIPEMPETL